MTLEPLINAPHLIQVHAFCAISTVVLGTIQFVAPKGTIPHRKVGWVFIGLMGGMVVTAFMNHDLVTWDPFGPKICCRAGAADCHPRELTCASIQILTLYVLMSLPFAALQARLSVKHHSYAMLALVLLMATGGAFTLVGPRVFHYVFFGPPPTTMIVKVKDRVPEGDVAVTGSIAQVKPAVTPVRDPAGTRYSQAPALPR